VVFSDTDFIFIFLPIALIAYFGIGRLVAGSSLFGLPLPTWIIVFLSIAFYVAWDFAMVFLLLASVTMTALAAPRVQQGQPYGKTVLTAAIAVHLAVLGYFKYANFLGENFSALFGAGWVELNVILPLGISFFTFQQISYLVDVRRGEAPLKSWPTIAAYISFFPQLIAGPIVRFTQVSNRLTQAFPPLDDRAVTIGCVFFCFGLIKKVFLADNLSLYADPVFAAANAGLEISTIEAVVGVLAFTFQIFFDFCGYSEMAIGLGYFFGFRLPVNFDHPYRAASIIEFWRRWHITLTSFFKDYVYIPLGGSRGGTAVLARNVIIVMFLSGLWHGAGWAFVIWGVLHGVLLVVAHGWRKLNFDGVVPRIPAWVGWFLTFAAAALLWIPFRAETLDGTLLVLHALFTPDTLVLPFGAEPLAERMGALATLLPPISYSNVQTVGALQAFGLAGGLPILPIAALVAFFVPNPGDIAEKFADKASSVLRAGAIGVLITGGFFAVALSGAPKEFVYFQF